MSLIRLALLFTVAGIAVNFYKQRSRTTALAHTAATLAATPGATESLGLKSAPEPG